MTAGLPPIDREGAANSGRRLLYWTAGLGLLIACLVLFSSVLLPFVVGAAIAYFLDPIADLLQRWRFPRWLAAALLTVGFLLFIVVFVLLLAPLLQAQILELVGRIPDYLDALRLRLMALLEVAQARLPPDQMAQLNEAASALASNAFTWLGGVLAGLWSGGVAILNLLSLIVITPIVTFYLLRDWDLIVAKIDSWLPRQDAEVIRAQTRLIDATLAGFVRGQVTVCMLVAAFYAISLTLVGLEFGLIVGLLTGLVSFIPYVGMIVGLVTSVGLAFAQFSDWQPIALVAAVFVIGQIVEGNVITPKLVGERVGLHPVWMIFALLAGGAMFGFLGVLLAVPVAAIIGVLARFAIASYLAGRFYSGAER